MPRALRVAVQMDPIETINIDADSTFALMLEAQRRGHSLWHYEVRHMALREGVKRQGERREERLFARARPVTVERKRGAHYVFGDLRGARSRHDGRGADAAGPAVRHGLHHRHPPAGAHPPEDAGGERPGRGAQRAGKNARHAFPRADAAHHGHLGPRGDPRIPRRAPGHHRQAAVRQRRRRRVPHQAGRREPRRAAGDALRPLARAADVPALRARGAPGRQAHHPGRRRAGGRGQPRARRRARRAPTCMSAGARRNAR